MISAKTANKIWIISQLSTASNFYKNCNNVEKTQSLKLKHYIKNNSSTLFGKKYNFKSIDSYSTFEKNIPIQEWNDIAPWVEQLKKGTKNVLTQQDVLLFEETSGTTSYSKLIPYTSLLKEEIQTGVAVWMTSLYQNKKMAFDGNSYWSISPPLKKKEKTIGGIPIGVDSDKDYFNYTTQYLLNKIIAVPSEVKLLNSSTAFYLKTFEHLLLKENLSFISVWSPTFFIQLDNFLKDYKAELLDILHTNYRNKDKRVSYIKERLNTDYTWKDLWPQLSVLSCWTDAQSAMWIDQVKKIAGSVYIQGKGLLSTEAISSIPVFPDKSPLLSIDSHFYEFRNMDSGKIYPAHLLKKDACYELIQTTGGGLYRYASGDIIQVTGYYKQVPAFIFVGRKNNQSDMVGEKLSEIHVLNALLSAPNYLLNKTEFIFVYPVANQYNKTHYRLYIEFREDYKEGISDRLNEISKTVEEELCKNPYYKTALDLNQLNPMQTHRLESGFKRKYISHLNTEFAIKDGNIKIPLLFKQKSLITLLGI